MKKNRVLCLFVSGLASMFLTTVFAWGAERAGASKSDHLVTLSEIMRRAAFEYPTVKAREKQIESTREDRAGVILDQLSLTGSIRSSRMTGRTDLSAGSLGPGAPALSLQTTEISKQRSVGMSFMLSLETWFRAKGMALTEQLQESALLALRMQLASDAAQALMTFNYVEGRLAQQRQFLSDLLKVQESVSSGRIALSQVNQGLLSGKIAELQASLGAAELQRETVKADLENFLDVENYEPDWPPIIQVRPWPGLPWSEIESTFPIPSTWEEAMARSENSPALIQAVLSQKQSRNQWYLTAAGYGPRVVLSFEKIESSVKGGAVGGGQNFKGDQVTAGIRMAIGGGVYHHLKATSLLEDAAQLDKQSEERRVKTTLKKLYPTHEYTRKQLQALEQGLKMSLPALGKAQPRSEKEVVEYVHLVSGVDASWAQLTEQLTALLMTRIRIHGLTGTLLEEVERQQGARP